MRRALVVALTCLLTGCATTSPRFEQDIATTFAQDDMRRLITADVELYYPAAYKEQALRVAARASECLTALRAHQVTRRDHGRALLFLTSSNYNNAYVGGMAQGEPLHSLNPLSATDELFHWYGLSAAETGDIACHEMFHYAHYEQVENLWRFVNAVFGPLVPSQGFLERWFTEGVAQFYEGRLQRATGRPNSPLYRGAFDSFVASRHGELGGGDFSVNQRELLPYSGAYLTGLYFVEYLAATYGEDKLWQLMDLQGRSVFSPLGATLRFQSVYGKDAGELLEDWSALLAKRPERERPATQRVVMEDVGQLARLASHPASGALALVSVGAEQPPMLRVFEANGALRFERHLVQLTPTREWVLAGPSSMTGLSFTADGKFLYLVNDDFIDRGDTRGQLWKLDATTGEVLHVWQDLGRVMGGSVSPDGRAYTYVEFPPSGAPRIVERDLESGATTVLYEGPVTTSLSAPAWSADHQRLAFSVLDGSGWNLVVREPDGSVRHVTTDGAFNYAPRWVDEHRVVFARTSGDYLQVHRLDVDTGALERLSDVAYGLVDPAPVPGGVAVINRDGVHWSLDLVGDAPLEVVQAAFPAEPGAIEPRHEPQPLAVEADAAYSGVDQLFVPQLRLPGIVGLGLSFSPVGLTSLTLSLDLAGRDRLGWHAWAIAGTFDPITLTNSASVQYRNLQLAPWSVALYAARRGVPSRDAASWAGSLAVERTFFTVPLSFGAQAEVYQRPGVTNRFIGAFASVAWASAESTAYAGAQRALSFAFDVAGYPAAFGSDRNMLDLRLGLSAAVPLPFSKRNSLVLSAIGRLLPGAPTDALEVGGISRGYAVSLPNGSGSVGGGATVFLPGGLTESLRGYDDTVVYATGAAIATARYRYSFIIDRGFMSTLWLLPSLFFRQVDAELFGSAAYTNSTTGPWARAAGAAVFARMTGGGALPISLYYQFAWRFDYALPPLHTMGIAFE